MALDKVEEQKQSRFNKPFFKFQDDQIKEKHTLFSKFMKNKKQQISIEIAKLVVSMIFELIVTVVLVFPYIVLTALFQFMKYFCTFWKKDITFSQNLINPLMQIIIGISILGLIAKCIIDYYKVEDVQHLWFMNAFYLFGTQLLIRTYIKSVKHNPSLKYKFSMKNLFGDDNIATNIYNVGHLHSKFIFDLQTHSWPKEYARILSCLEVDGHSQKFNTFFSNDNNPTTCEFKGYQMIKGQNVELLPGKWQYFALTIVAFIKVCLTLLFLYRFTEFNYVKIISLVMLTLFYINITYVLSKILGSYDLRRKTMILRKINDAILLSGGEIDYFTKIDILSTMSLETWDNTRRAVLAFFSDEQKRLEACYVCLFFYYIFVSIVCFTAYGEIYIFISQDSIYLHPIMVISNTLDFVFLNILLFTRIYNGQKFNATFEETIERIDSLIGVTEDLQQIYDYYFNKPGIDEKLYLEFTTGPDNHKFNISALPPSSQNKGKGSPQIPPASPFLFPQSGNVDQVIDLKSSKLDESNLNNLNLVPQVSRYSHSNLPNLQSNQSQKQEKDEDKWSFDNIEFYTIYDIFVAKLKYNSVYFIDNKIEFQGQSYEFNFRKQLHLNMLESTFESLIRIKEQIEVDSKTSCYKFFNLIKVEFQETLITVVLAIMTVMPKVLETFINFYKK